MSPSLIGRTFYAVSTLYMMLILLRWLAPWLELNLHGPRLSWIPRWVDPLLNAVRRVLPAMGPMDFAPLASLFAVWLLRTIVLKVV